MSLELKKSCVTVRYIENGEMLSLEIEHITGAKVVIQDVSDPEQVADGIAQFQKIAYQAGFRRGQSEKQRR